MLHLSIQLNRGIAAALLLGGTLLAAAPAHAVVDAPIVFSQAGQVNIRLTGNAGGFDHLLEPVMVFGNGVFGAGVPTPPNTPPFYNAPWIIGTENGSLLSLVGDPGSPRSPTAFNYNWGYFDVLPGQEITFRLTNILTNRIGGANPDELGTIVSQLFTGTSAVSNTQFGGGSVLGGNPGAPTTGLSGGYTNVVFTSPTEINVYFEDLDPNRDINSRWQNMSVQLILTPVPEASTYAMMLLGLLGLVAAKRRMAQA